MGREAGDFVPETLGGDEGLAKQYRTRSESKRTDTNDFINDTLVGVEVKREARVAGHGGPTSGENGRCSEASLTTFQ